MRRIVAMAWALTVGTVCSRPLAAEVTATPSPPSVSVSASAAAAFATERAAFMGSWEFVDVQPPGATKNASRLVFRDDGTYAALDANGRELWGGTFELNPAACPKIWDHRSYASAKTGGDTLGIYALDGDRLRLCAVGGRWHGEEWVGKVRPNTFELGAGDVLLELRRVKEEK
jgi:uncharacterized protein (TIGR03067 family)